MTKNLMRWHPVSGESQTFETINEVPEGWLDYHPHGDDAKAKSEKPKAAAKSDEVPMTREEIVAALNAGEVKFAPNAGLKSLYTLLVKNLKEHLTILEVKFDETASGPELLEILNKAE